MPHRIGFGLLGTDDLILGNERASDGRTQQIVGFIGRMRTKHRVAVLLSELLTQILDDDFISAGLVGFFLDTFEFIALAQFAGKCHELHARIAFFKPGENDGGIQPAGVGEDDFLGVFGCSHGSDSSKNRGLKSVKPDMVTRACV